MRKKKKGRPSLSDLQKRNLKQLPDQPEEQHPETLIASGPNFNTPPRRSTRRNPSVNGTTPPSGADRVSHDEDEDEDDDEDERKEKKVKLVVRLPHSNHHYSHPRSSAANSLSLNSASCGSDSNADGDNHDVSLNNPKINAAGVGSGDQLEKVQKAMDTLHGSGSQLETGPTTPLPDKKFLVFILDRLQKKDTYGVFSEPVDPNELPDYHEIIEHPMDFGTVRRKLEDGHYPNLDEFEADVFLICSNAMLYNAPDTIYYRQAKSIKDLAKRDFENLRQVNDDGEPEPKIVRRGRPPSKNLKKSVGSPPFERVGPESSSDATLATVGDNAIGSNSYNLRKAPMPFRFRSDDSLFRAAHQSRNSETGTDWLSEWNSEFPASVLKAEAKYGKKQFPLDENRRATYKQFHPSAFAHDPSALTTLNGDIKQLMGVGLHSEHGYARSLARFAANLGPVAWKIASRKIECVLPPGVKFGPGWVGDDGVSSRSPSALQEQKYSNNLVHDAHPQEPVEGVSGHNSNNESDVSKSGFGGISPGPSFQTQQKLILQPHRSGFNGVSGYDLSSQMGMVRGRLPLSTGQSGLEEASVPPQMLGVVPRGNTSLTTPQSQDYNWIGSFSNHNQQHLNMLQSGSVSKSEAAADVSGNQQLENDHGSYISASTHVNQHKSYHSMGMAPAYDTATVSQNEFSSGSHGFVHSGNFSQQVDQPIMHQNEPMYVSKNYLGNQNSVNFPQQFPSSQQLVPTAGRSSAGRPPHALVTFGFGGKLIVAKDNSSLSVSSYGSQGHVGGSISVLNLMEVVTQKFEASSTGVGSCDYFDTLCRQSFPGPLVGGNVGSREVNKWIDERIASCESSEVDYRKVEVLRLLLSLLKIACQYYGKLRSPFGTDAALKESDVPESAVAKLFASVKRNSGQFSNYGALAPCLQQLPSEGQMQATAAEVQALLVSGRKKEALHSASEGQLWGPALVLAAQLGDQFYANTVKKMALHQLVAGSPLRTLCLLIAGQPAEVFSADTSNSSIPGAMNMSPQLAQYGANFMLDDWEENLAVITANRTKDDELVLTHLGDCLWKDRSEIFAAHICYLVAEANFEPYSDSARLCLVGADHWKFPRTYASPDAIQRTELFEYSKVLGNPQFTLLPFQPYKLIYAHMLAEVGKVTESLKYCQAVYKSLKTGRAPEVDTWRQLVSSLEERIRTHQQGGYSTNLAAGKLVGKLLNLFDSTAHRVVGGLPPPVPSTSHSNIQPNVHHYETMVPRVSTSQSTMAMSSLMPSASVEPINELTGDGSRMTIHTRSISEPDFGRTPRQVDSSKETTSSSTSGKASASGPPSRFGRFSFGSQLLQKTVGLVLKPRQDRQAKLGEKNKFYYDENLKRWVEEGAEPPAEETALPPPPTSAALQNGMSDYNLKSVLKSENSPSNGSPEFTSPTMERSSGIPPIPTVQNQFSARGRTGVRSRYVDTFNKGGGNPTNLFQSPPVPSVKPASGANPKFFVPTPVTTSEQNFDPMEASVKEPAAINQNLSSLNNWTDSPAPLSSTPAMLRFPSVDNISNNETMVKGSGSLSAHSRRTASWSGSFIPEHKSPQKTNLRPLGEVLGISPSSFMPSETSSLPLPTRGGSFGDDLHEVEL